jgi:filamentous hemagglutinin family protein
MTVLKNELKLLAFTCYLFSTVNSANAQLIPDSTLPVNSSVAPGCQICNIEAGTQRGNNLFHSFSQFSVPTNGAALFNNDISVQNILTRITGTNVSNIDGLIQAQGGANLFIINPNGIVIGANAKLNIGGSFVATTATGVKFADGTEFSAVNSNAPLLTISTPIGLNLVNNNAAITVQGRGHGLVSQGAFTPIFSTQNGSEFQVRPQKTLALVSGNILLDGGVLIASGGRVELGGVQSGEVKLNWAPDVQLDYAGISNFGDITIKQRGLADVSGASSGSMQVSGNNISIADGSLLFSQNFGFLPSGNINVNANFLKLDGSSVDGFIRSGIYYQNFGFAQNGDINVNTKQLFLDNGASIINRTLSRSKSGDVNINATEFVQLKGFAINNPSITTTINTSTTSTGKAGNINIKTPTLSLFNSGTLSSANFIEGMSGDITVNADVINISDSNPITVPSSISAPNFGTGKAGNLTLNTRILSLRSGGQISTTSFNSGDAGNIIINASESIEVIGSAPIFTSISSSVDKPPELVGRLLGLFDTPTATSGSIAINTNSLFITNAGVINVRNEGVGQGGNLEINANSLVITDYGILAADTLSGQGGNINLQLNDLRLRRGSLINTSAGGSGGGGNINIDTNTLVAFENSDITANSQDSRGGRVSINAQGIFGTEFRTSLTPQSDITATSALGAEFNGVVDINTIAADPSSGLVELPESVVDNSQQITASCTTPNTNQFTIVGNGGLPSSPDDLSLQATTIIEPVDLVSSHTASKTSHSSKPEIIEAQKLVIDKNDIYLAAQTPSIPPIPKPTCNK